MKLFSYLNVEHAASLQSMWDVTGMVIKTKIITLGNEENNWNNQYFLWLIDQLISLYDTEFYLHKYGTIEINVYVIYVLLAELFDFMNMFWPQHG